MATGSTAQPTLTKTPLHIMFRAPRGYLLLCPLELQVQQCPLGPRLRRLFVLITLAPPSVRLMTVRLRVILPAFLAAVGRAGAGKDAQTVMISGPTIIDTGSVSSALIGYLKLTRTHGRANLVI